MKQKPLDPLLEQALSKRLEFFEDEHRTAVRLMNGFTEDFKGFTIDLYGQTLLLMDYRSETYQPQDSYQQIQDFYTTRFPWIKSMVIKMRQSKHTKERCGILVYGNEPDQKIQENSIWYSIDLQMSSDASFYLDTRHLREWLVKNLSGKTVLNLFSYTGSLGVAASRGGATNVTHLDRNKKYFSVAQKSYDYNNLPWSDRDFVTGDFFKYTAAMKSQGKLVDCIILDPPFFSSTKHGRIDLNNYNDRLIKKVRPIIAHNGYLVVINNALYLSGKDFYELIEEQCKSGYLNVETIIDIPVDYCGYQNYSENTLPENPTPFNYSTKIVILRVKRRDRRKY